MSLLYVSDDHVIVTPDVRMFVREAMGHPTNSLRTIIFQLKTSDILLTEWLNVCLPIYQIYLFLKKTDAAIDGHRHSALKFARCASQIGCLI